MSFTLAIKNIKYVRKQQQVCKHIMGKIIKALFKDIKEDVSKRRDVSHIS